MNPTELKVAREYRNKGYTVLRDGWPDFLMIRGDEIVLVEVKLKCQEIWDNQGLSDTQVKMREVLSKYFKYVLRHEIQEAEISEEDKEELRKNKEERLRRERAYLETERKAKAVHDVTAGKVVRSITTPMSITDISAIGRAAGLTCGMMNRYIDQWIENGQLRRIGFRKNPKKNVRGVPVRGVVVFVSSEVGEICTINEINPLEEDF